MYIFCNRNNLNFFDDWIDAYRYSLNMQCGAIINYDDRGFWRVGEFELTYKGWNYCVY